MGLPSRAEEEENWVICTERATRLRSNCLRKKGDIWG